MLSLGYVDISLPFKSLPLFSEVYIDVVNIYLKTISQILPKLDCLAALGMDFNSANLRLQFHRAATAVAKVPRGTLRSVLSPDLFPNT